jgi:hypothetical protein
MASKDAKETKLGAPAANKNASFWDRKDILEAMLAVDVWASCKHHRLQRCYGLPTIEWIDGKDHMLYRLVKSGRRFVTFLGDDDEWVKLCAKGRAAQFEVTLPSTRVDRGKIPYARLVELVVDGVLGELNNPHLVHALLLHRYPRSGPYERSTRESSYRRFRPNELKQWIGGLGGRMMQQQIDRLLQQAERDFLDTLAQEGGGRRSRSSAA